MKKRFLKSVSIVSIVAIIVKLFGFIRQIITASAFGATTETDIIFMSEGLIANVEFILMQIIATSFVSIYIHARSKDELSANSFTLNAFLFFLLIGLMLAGTFVALSDLISFALAPSYSENLRNVLSNYIKLFSPLLLGFSLIAVSVGVLNANKRFVPGQLIGLTQSVVIILMTFVFKDIIGVRVLVYGYFIYVIINLLFIFLLSKKYWKFKKTNLFKDYNILAMLKMILPLLISYSMIFLNQQVDKSILSGFESGTITAVGYAAVLMNFVLSLIEIISTVLYPQIVELVATDNIDGAYNKTFLYMILTITAVIPISFISFLLSKDIVTIVFGHGSFDSSAINMAAIGLMGYSLCFVPFSIKCFSNKLFYSQKRTKIVTLTSTIGIACNIGLSIFLSRFFGIIGVTLATSIAEIICASLNIFFLFRKRKINLKIPLLSFALLWLIGLVYCIIVGFLLKNLIDENNAILRFLIVSSGCLIGYGLLTIPFIISFKKRRLALNDL